MSELEAQVREELQGIVAVLQELTGLPSRWSGRVELVPDAEFKGKKRFSCDIQIDAALAQREARWSTLIHEALHSLSAGYLRDDYQDYQGWEEGVVEQLQRLFRPNVLARMGIGVKTEQFQLLDAEHAYNEFVEALETLRELLNVSESEKQGFYVRLLAVPIKNRLGHVFNLGMQLPTDRHREFVGALSVASAALRTRRMEGVPQNEVRH